MALLTTIIMLCIRSPEFIHLGANCLVVIVGSVFERAGKWCGASIFKSLKPEWLVAK